MSAWYHDAIIQKGAEPDEAHRHGNHANASNVHASIPCIHRLILRRIRRAISTLVWLERGGLRGVLFVYAKIAGMRKKVTKIQTTKGRKPS